VVGHQAATPAKPELWLVKPRQAGALAVWLTREELALTGEPRWWQR